MEERFGSLEADGVGSCGGKAGAGLLAERLGTAYHVFCCQEHPILEFCAQSQLLILKTPIQGQ